CGTKFKIEDTDKKTLIGNTLPNMTILSGYNKTSLQNEILQKIRDWFKNQLKPIIEPRSQLTEYAKSKLYKGKINTKQLINLLEVADFNISMPIINKEEIDKELIEEVKEKFPGVYKSMVKNKTEEAFFRLNLFFEHIIKKKDNKEKTYKLDGDLESLGTLRYFGLSGVLTEIIDRTGVLFIDELDSSLHPDLLNQFINTFMLNTKHSQLIFTTHYYPLLEETDELRKDVVWFTEKKEDGSTDLFSLKDINIRAALNYYKAYKTGKFGAKPFIGSAYLSRNEIDNE
ncbi:MAG: ATP-binding protein, partial [Candidatus Cloacimonetes bacterium]|nr:ATP-binding protein [Candidatus Cloacimonadota bacterium]